MILTINREDLLPALTSINGVVERRQTLPILSNLLFTVEQGGLTMTGTDMEVELVLKIENVTGLSDNLNTTLPARKFLDICKALPSNADITLDISEKKAVIRSGKSRFTLTTMPASDFPNVGETKANLEFAVKNSALKDLIEKTQFAMAHQDVRYYLNGLMLEISSGLIRAVATDGHRLALCDAAAEINTEESLQIILPRKGVTELSRMLDKPDELSHVSISNNHLQIIVGTQRFTSKLIDGKFPDYERVVPKNSDKLVIADRETLRQGLTRTSILSNEKFRGIRLNLGKNTLGALAHNPEQEEAQEDIDVTYEGDSLEIGFNVTYMLDVLSTIKTDMVELHFSDANSSCLMKPDNDESCKYVVMPMRL